jgi:hypothetical protein
MRIKKAAALGAGVGATFGGWKLLRRLGINPINWLTASWRDKRDDVDAHESVTEEN